MKIFQTNKTEKRQVVTSCDYFGNNEVGALRFEIQNCDLSGKPSIEKP